MSGSDIEDFLVSVNSKFAKYAEPLTDAGLTEPEELADMLDEDFKNLGVPIFHWRKILAAAKNQYGDDEPQPHPVTETPSDPPMVEAYSNGNNNGGSAGGGGKYDDNPMFQWGTEEVALYIRTLDEGSYAASAKTFENQNVDGSQMLHFTGVKQLTKLVPDLGARYAIFEAIQACKEGNVPSIRALLKLDKDQKISNRRNSSRGGGNDSPVPSIEASHWGADTSNDSKAIINKSKIKKGAKFAISKEESTMKQRLIKFYQIYNPQKLEDVAGIDELLKRYQGRERQLFADLETKYILSTKTVVKRKKLAVEPASKTNIVLHELSRLYHENIRAVELAYDFPKFHTPVLDEVDFLAKPMVLLVGQYSTGKTSFIRYLIGRDFPGIRVGPEPTTDAFGAIMWGKEERLIPGHTVPMDRSKPFRTLQNFGAGFLNKFACAEVPAPILESITFIDTPGILSGTKQRSRNYDFAKVVEWFAYRCDRILLLFDAHKLDISDEFKAAILMLKGHDDKIRCVLNKADAVSNQQLLRVYGALMWSLGKVFKTPEVLRVYVGSFWDEDYQNDHNAALFDSEASDLINDLKGLPRHCATRKINEFVKRTRQMRVHALIVEHMRKQFGLFTNKSKKQSKMLDNLRGEFRAIAKLHGLNLNDFPNPEKFKVLISKMDISNFPKFNKKWVMKFDKVLEEEIPNLMKKLPSQGDGGGGSRGGHSTGEKNPFLNSDEPGIAKGGGGPKWVVTGVEKRNFDTKFYALGLNKGFASGNQVMNVMLQSGLSKIVLRNVWELSDIDQDGSMDHEEFALSMYLIDMVKEGVKLPPTLPISLIPPGKRHLVEIE